LGIHGNSGFGLESEGVGGIMDAQQDSGETDRPHGVQTVSQHLHEDSLFDCEGGTSDYLSGGGL